MSTWESEDGYPTRKPLGFRGGVRLVVRGVPLVLMLCVGLVLLLTLRLVERPIWGLSRPITPFITQFVCRNAFRLMGIGYSIQGTPMNGQGAVVANHSSWLDIFALNASQQVYFVSKSEVAKWPGIGWLARATGTVFISRDRREARAQRNVFEDRLLAGHQLLFFPEGTSSDGLRVLPFKSTLFAAFFEPRLRQITSIQSVSVRYFTASDTEPRIYGWWGGMDFGSHLVSLLAQKNHGRVELIYHPPLKVADFSGRKEIATAAQAQVEQGFSSQ